MAGPYAHGLGLGHAGVVAHAAPLAYAHASPLAYAHAGPALPTISPGDLQGAAIEAHVDASDHVRASVDAAREYHDQASELQGQAINAAEDHSWQAVDAVKTAQAQLDGAAAGVAPVLAKQLAGHVAPVAAYAAPAVYAHGAPLAHGYAAPLAHGYAAPLAHGYGASLAHGYAAPALAASKTVVSQSLSQTHPGVVAHAAYAAAPVVSHGYAAGPVLAHGYAGHGLAHGYAGHGLAHGW